MAYSLQKTLTTAMMTLRLRQYFNMSNVFYYSWNSPDTNVKSEWNFLLKWSCTAGEMLPLIQRNKLRLPMVYARGRDFIQSAPRPPCPHITLNTPWTNGVFVFIQCILALKSESTDHKLCWIISIHHQGWLTKQWLVASLCWLYGFHLAGIRAITLYHL